MDDYDNFEDWFNDMRNNDPFDELELADLHFDLLEDQTGIAVQMLADIGILCVKL
jgi:hypothetical protein